MFLSILHVNAGDNPDRPNPGRKWLGDIYRIHQRLWMAFPDDERRSEDPFFLGAWNTPGEEKPKPPRRDLGFLFRVERDGEPRILVQSAQRPDWEYAFQNAPYLLKGGLEHGWRRREFDPSPVEQCAYRFRLLANVVDRKSAPYSDGRSRTTSSGLTLVRKRRFEIPVLLLPVPAALPNDPAERDRVLSSRWEPWRDWLNQAGADAGFRIDENLAALRMEGVHTTVRNSGKGSNQEKPKRFNAGLFEGALVCTDPAKLREAVINGVGSAKAFGFGLLSLASAPVPNSAPE